MPPPWQEPPSITLQPRQHPSSPSAAPWAVQDQREAAWLLPAVHKCHSARQMLCTFSTGQEPAWAPHSLGGYLAAPRGLWGGQQLSHPLSSCRSRGAASQTICCTDFVLLSLSGAAWSLPRRGPGMARSLYWILIVLLSGVGKKKISF